MNVSTTPENPGPLLELRLLRTEAEEKDDPRTDFTTTIRKNVDATMDGTVHVDPETVSHPVERRRPENTLRITREKRGYVIPRADGSENVLAGGSADKKAETFFRNVQTFFDTVGELSMQAWESVRIFHQNPSATLRNEQLDGGPNPSHCTRVAEALDQLEHRMKDLSQQIVWCIADASDAKLGRRSTMRDFTLEADKLRQKDKAMNVPWNMSDWCKLIMKMKDELAKIPQSTKKPEFDIAGHIIRYLPE